MEKRLEDLQRGNINVDSESNEHANISASCIKHAKRDDLHAASSNEASASVIQLIQQLDCHERDSPQLDCHERDSPQLDSTSLTQHILEASDLSQLPPTGRVTLPSHDPVTDHQLVSTQSITPHTSHTSATHITSASGLQFTPLSDTTLVAPHTTSAPHTALGPHPTESRDHPTANDTDTTDQSLPEERTNVNESYTQNTARETADEATGVGLSTEQGEGNDEELAEDDPMRLTTQPDKLEGLVRYAAVCLQKYGVCVLENVFGSAVALSMLREAQALHDAQLMSDGLVTGTYLNRRSERARSDLIAWVDGTEQTCHTIAQWMKSMDVVAYRLNQILTGIEIDRRTKAMVACYPGEGRCYVRHVDNPNRDGRVITCLYYLNPHWDVRQHGGALRIYPEGTNKMAQIEPLLDRLVMFWSDRRNPHEVLPSYSTRYAVTVWYMDKKEREEAKERGLFDNQKVCSFPLFNRSSV